MTGTSWVRKRRVPSDQWSQNPDALLDPVLQGWVRARREEPVATNRSRLPGRNQIVMRSRPHPEI